MDVPDESRQEWFKFVVKSVIESVHKSKLEKQMLQASQAAIYKANDLTNVDLKKTVVDILKSSGLERQLRNAVYQHMMELSIPTRFHVSIKQSLVEPSYIAKAQANWEKRVVKSLNSMCTELNVSLAKQRTEREVKEYKARWTELGTISRDLSKFRPVYAPKDFLEVVAALRNPNINESQGSYKDAFWGMIQVPIKVPNITELKEFYVENGITLSQCGIDDSPDVPSELFEMDRVKLARRVIVAGHAPLSAQFAKRGCPVTYRATIWCQMLSIELDEMDTAYYERLKVGSMRHDLLVDNLVFKDVKLTAANDDQYFVFEDYLYQILLPFSRDTFVLERLAQTCATAPKSYIGGKHGLEEYAVNYPPCGIIPFHGFCMLVAPLCYVFNNPVHLYFVFREIYVRYFLRLHVLSSHRNGIVSVCRLFESLLQSQQPQLSHHLKMIGLQPLRIAFKWFVRAYSGYLASEEVLLLWDRILAYNSLDILAILAVAIFAFRKTNLMQVTAASAAEVSIIADVLV